MMTATAPHTVTGTITVGQAARRPVTLQTVQVEIGGHVYDLAYGQRSGQYYELCSDCDGTGYRPGYAHVDGSRCWPCGYSGIYRTYTDLAEVTKVMKRRESGRARAAKQREAEAAAHAAKQAQRDAQWQADNADLIAWAAAVDTTGMDRFEASKVSDLNRGIVPNDEIAQSLRAIMDRMNAATGRAATSAWWGTEGKRETVTVTVQKIIPIRDPYGYGVDPTKPLIIMVTDEGAELKWFTTWSYPEEIAEGARLTVAATVKRHDISDSDFNRGAKETIVTRVKVQK
jgi:hypothetical protein